ncbi:DoxX family protein [Halostreptopolyspora alba]|uniref:DoxX family protein n=1 Tax=Halostreptopolyspora alba TaxID=2487137 RepID=UPI0026AD2C92
MSVFVVLVVVLLGARLLGALGVRRLASWPDSTAYGLAAMLVLTAGSHFVPGGTTTMPDHADLVAMVPPFVPFADVVVYATGVLELAGAVGLVVAATRRAVGAGLAALFVLLSPANVYAAVADVPFDGGEATPLWLRLPLQAALVALALWVARRAGRAAVGDVADSGERENTTESGSGLDRIAHRG